MVSLHTGFIHKMCAKIAGEEINYGQLLYMIIKMTMLLTAVFGVLIKVPALQMLLLVMYNY